MKIYWYLLIAAVAYYLYSQKQVSGSNYASAVEAINGVDANGQPLQVQPIDVGATLTNEFLPLVTPPYQVPTVQFVQGPSGAN